MTEERADGLVLTRHSHLEEVTTLLQKFDLLEHSSEQSDELKAIALREEVVDEGLHAHRALVVASLNEEVRADTIPSDLIQDQSFHVSVLKQVLRLFKIDA